MIPEPHTVGVGGLEFIRRCQRWRSWHLSGTYQACLSYASTVLEAERIYPLGDART